MLVIVILCVLLLCGDILCIYCSSQNPSVSSSNIKLSLLWIIVLCLLIIMPIMIGTNSYKLGQINALNGIIEFKLQKNDLSEDVWKYVPIEDKRE